jgi:glycosyltransferase involved in cell wall biosynthesis
MGTEGRAKARLYSWRRVALRVLEFYEELLNRKGNLA